MRKIISFLSCCLISGHCFTQSATYKDSSKITTVLTHKAKENTPNNLKPELTIYPNPAKNKITIQVKNFHPGMAAVKVLDVKGKLVREDNRLLTNGTEDIIMFLMLKAGIYFILVSEPGKEARKKLVVF
ncbi:MAG: T9SS type A sorting domain-containing protein [Ferruginibacter sp.]|nr:T9SS type A sorting domain-containing protein [Ferruginibacter sp.]